jgi:hypothetical protein
MPKIERYTIENGRKVRHVLHLNQIDQMDEISGDEQFVMVWCDVHKTYEWHWLERELIP